MVKSGLLTAALLVVVFGVVGTATSDGVPGDSLYPAKRIAEQPIELVAPGIVVSNRLDELEVLVGRQAEADVVLDARTDAALALAGQQDDDLNQVFNLLAWPGALVGQGVNVGFPREGLLISEATWIDDGAYRASLVDGQVVTISSLDGDVLISTTGDWTVATTTAGWRLSSDSVDQIYLVEQVGDDLRISAPDTGQQRSEGTNDGGRSGGASIAIGDTESASPDPEPTARPATTNEPATTTGPDNTGTEPTPAPTTQAPITQAPITQAPTTQSPATEPSTTQPPATQSPTTRPPATQSPTTQSPTTQPPATQAPTPQPPATQPSPTQPPDTQPPPTQPPGTQPPTTQAPTPVLPASIYLSNPGTGNSSSSSNLPLSAGSVPSGPLGNYDTNRDGGPGLMIQKDGAGLSTGDETKHQVWTWSAPAATAFDGQISMTIWLAAKDLKSGERIGFLASLELCDPTCVRLDTAQWTASASGPFRQATVSFGSIDTAVSAGDRIRLKIVVPDGLADTDVWFGYDAGAYPSKLEIG